ncbi:hypothetical protein ONZ43_g1899 [Nemania bipapillata]|uniref:Uncharacterized protein n=1 Tax=Nemania bipapillata TaxID=110536 RepID=A0ACC2J2Q6_9PEZI|nr:hypothetical protein ONZ43_g1899 [Nemania bipapillata]
MRYQLSTLVLVTYGVDGRPHHKILSGRKPDFLSLPEEGLYVLFRNRGLQIASACEEPKCFVTQVCHCKDHYQHMDAGVAAMAAGINDNLTKINQDCIQDLGRRFGKACVLAWFRIRNVAHEIRTQGLCSLAHPQILSSDSPFGGGSFSFDSDIRRHYGMEHSYTSMTPASWAADKGKDDYPRRMIDFIAEAWMAFVEDKNCDFNLATKFAELEGYEDKDGNEDGENGKGWDCAGKEELDVLEWDDVDVPVEENEHPSAALLSHHEDPLALEEGYDLLDDLNDEEFPELRRCP